MSSSHLHHHHLPQRRPSSTPGKAAAPLRSGDVDRLLDPEFTGGRSSFEGSTYVDNQVGSLDLPPSLKRKALTCPGLCGFPLAAPSSCSGSRT